MEEWADWLVIAVKEESDPSRISHVKCRRQLGNNLLPEETIFPKDIVILMIKRGVTFITVTKTQSDQWQKGEAVIVATRRGREYIKTVPDQEENDNLGNLPRFV